MGGGTEGEGQVRPRVFRVRRAIVTGVGHRSGIGYAVCQALARGGTQVFATRWTPFDDERSWSQDRELPWPNVNADLGDPLSPKAVFDAAEAKMGGVDILVNNHTFFKPDSLLALSPEVLDRHLAVNVRGTLLLCQEFVRRNSRGWGRIVNLTSGQGLHPMPEELSYAVSKGAMEAATLTLSGALAPAGITVNAVDPGGTDTGWMESDLRTSLLDQSPRGRIGMPDDAARLIAFLASEDSEWITGQIIRSRGWT